MRGLLVEFLGALGVVDAQSDPLLGFVLDSTEQAVRNAINREEIPEGLTMCVVQRAAGEYLRLKKGMGQLDGFDPERLDLSPAVKQLTEGDVSVAYAVGDASLTPEQRMDRVIDVLAASGGSQFGRYRKVMW